MHALRLLPLIFYLAINAANASGLNDTGITTCSNASQNGLPCPVSGFPRQDAEYGPNTFSFTKLDAAGNPLPDTATNQVCVFDNHTGLVWEVKTDDGGLRDKDNTYTFDEAAAFATAVNAAGGLCGFTDWRVPNPQELDNLADFSIPYQGPTINTSYFPNTLCSSFSPQMNPTFGTIAVPAVIVCNRRDAYFTGFCTKNVTAQVSVNFNNNFRMPVIKFTSLRRLSLSKPTLPSTSSGNDPIRVPGSYQKT